MAKEAKADVSYQLGHKDSHCGPVFKDDHDYCQYFIPPTGRDKTYDGTCIKVEGPIRRAFWCKRFKEMGK